MSQSEDFLSENNDFLSLDHLGDEYDGLSVVMCQMCNLGRVIKDGDDSERILKHHMRQVHGIEAPDGGRFLEIISRDSKHPGRMRSCNPDLMEEIRLIFLKYEIAHECRKIRFYVGKDMSGNDESDD